MSLINEFSIQLYSVHEEMQKDFIGVLKRIAKMGYTGVEFAGYGGIPANEMKALLTELGLKSIGSHVSVDESLLIDDEIEYNSILGTQYLICPGMRFNDREDSLRNAETFSKAADKTNSAGIKFAYHNHDHEFKKDGGEYLLDIFYANASPDVLLELDVYWAAYAGVEPVSYIEKHANRTALLHIKQMEDYSSKRCVDLNKGVLDFSDIITKSKKLGVEQFILEQEEFDGDPFTSLQLDFNYIMNL